MRFYLLIDDRVNDYRPGSPYDDASLGPPDTQWILDDGWKPVNVGLSPSSVKANKDDSVGIDEGNNRSLYSFYTLYTRSLTQPGEIKLHTEIDGNSCCLVIDTNRANLGIASVSVGPRTPADS